MREGEYPCCDDQTWARPDVDRAVELLDAAIADPEKVQPNATRGRRDVRNSFRAIGLQALDRGTASPTCIQAVPRLLTACLAWALHRAPREFSE